MNDRRPLLRRQVTKQMAALLVAPRIVPLPPAYAVSQRMRKRIEEVFRWMKTVGGMRKLRRRWPGDLSNDAYASAVHTTWRFHPR